MEKKSFFGRFARYAVLLAKSAKLIKIFKAVKLLKFTKPIVTFGSMAISAIVYSFFLGPWFAVGLVVMLFVHEMGHVWAMQLKGMPTRAPVFIPMLGAVIFAPPFKSREEEAFVGYGGPLIGSIAGILMFGIWAITPGRPEILLLISYVAIFLNLFNLIPIRPLDGGRVTQVTGSWFKYLGIGILLLLTAYIRQPAILLIWILVLDDITFHPKLKAGVGLACEALMIALIAMGYSSQGFWVDIYDIVLASFFNLMLVVDASMTGKEMANWRELQGKELPQAPTEARVWWIVRYLVLAVVLIIVMLFQAPYLPKQLHQ